jgi:hypothetical protein
MCRYRSHPFGRTGSITRVSNGVKIAIYRVLSVATAVFWVAQGWRAIRGGDIDSGPIAVLWLSFFGLFLLAIPWSADARAERKSRRTLSDT